jgi:N-acetylmuramoyl-L-alanine amidase
MLVRARAVTCAGHSRPDRSFNPLDDCTMHLTRRHFLVAGVGLIAGGCQSSTSLSHRPDPLWPDPYGRPVPHPGATAVRPPAATIVRPPIVPTPPQTPAVAQVHVIPRSQWAHGGPKLDRINPMGYVNRITVHHEGSTPVWFTDAASSAKRLESIRNFHQQRGWADIGYHYVIDRGGRIWEGRNIAYQGAHVRDNNENNVGVMLLGNFDQQTPSQPQIGSLHGMLKTLERHFRVQSARLYTHQELNRTECPGDSLQAHMVAIRRAGIV